MNKEELFMEEVMKLAAEKNIDCLLSTNSGIKIRMSNADDTRFVDNITSAMNCHIKIKDEFLYKGPETTDEKKHYASIEIPENIKKFAAATFKDLGLKATDIYFPYRFHRYTFRQLLRVIFNEANKYDGVAQLSFVMPLNKVKIITDAKVTSDEIILKLSPECEGFLYDNMLPQYLTIRAINNSEMPNITLTPESRGTILAYKKRPAYLSDRIVDKLQQVNISSDIIDDQLYLLNATIFSLCKIVDQYLYGLGKINRRPGCQFIDNPEDLYTMRKVEDYSFQNIYDYLKKFEYNKSRESYHFLGTDRDIPEICWYIHKEKGNHIHQITSFSILYQYRDKPLAKVLFMDFRVVSNKVISIDVSPSLTSDINSVDLIDKRVVFNVNGISDNISAKSIATHGNQLIKIADIDIFKDLTSPLIDGKYVIWSFLNVLFEDITTGFNLIDLEKE